MARFLPAGLGLGGAGGVEPPGPGAGSCLGPLPGRGPPGGTLAPSPVSSHMPLGGLLSTA